MISPNELKESQGQSPVISGQLCPKMPFGREKNKPMNTISTISLLTFYEKGYFNDYPECKEWIEDNLL